MSALKSPFAGELTRADAAALAGHLRVLIDPSRLRIISLLHANKVANGVQLVAALGVRQPTISHHMQVLTASGLVRATAVSTYVWYRLDYDAFAELAGLLQPVASDA